MTVAAVNDTPVASGTYAHSVTDTAALDTFSNLTGTLAATDVDTGDSLTWSGSATGTYGALSVNANGTYSYVVNAAAVNALQLGSSTTDNFTVTVTDSQGATATRSIVMTVVAANDTPVVTNNASARAAAVTEAGHLDNGQAVLFGMGVDGLTHVTGALSASDPDAGATQTWSITDATPSTAYGTLSINAATGAWNYALNNYLPGTQALKEGDTVTLTYTARVTDDKGAYADQTVTLTITGTNDVPVVANGAAALQGAVTEAGLGVAGTATASATLSASDVDAAATQTWSLVGTPSSTYGSMTINASTGVWTYTLDNTNAATQALAAGQSVVETFTARVTDDKGAFVNQTISVTINGSNDAPTVTAAAATATLVEAGGVANGTAGTSASSITLTKVDVDGTAGYDQSAMTTAGWVTADTGVTYTKLGTYGAATLTSSSSVVSYALNNSDTDTQALTASASASDSFTVYVKDNAAAPATANVNAVFNIAGTEDAPTGAIVISGTSTPGHVLTATSTLVDVDSALGPVQYQWLSDGVPITGATNSSYTLVAGDIGKSITAAASYTDGGTPMTSSSHGTVVQPASSGTGPSAQDSVVATMPVTPIGAGSASLVSMSLNSNNGGTDVLHLTQSNGPGFTLPGDMTAPLGTFALASSGNTTGGENFSLYVDSSLAVNGYWVENAAHVWINLASPTYGGSTVIEGSKIRLDFTIADGSQFDTNPASNQIAAIGSAAHMDLSLIGHTADTPVDGFFF